MNGKKAKMLRNLARENTIGLPEKNYVFESRTIRNRKNKNGQVFQTGTVFLQDCTRATYKALKRAYKQGITA